MLTSQIICLHEHFYALNLPQASTEAPDQRFLSLSPAYLHTHVLAGLLLTEVFGLLQSSSVHRVDAVHLLFDVLLTCV